MVDRTGFAKTVTGLGTQWDNEEGNQELLFTSRNMGISNAGGDQEEVTGGRLDGLVAVPSNITQH